MCVYTCAECVCTECVCVYTSGGVITDLSHIVDMVTGGTFNNNYTKLNNDQFGTGTHSHWNVTSLIYYVVFIIMLYLSHV